MVPRALGVVRDLAKAARVRIAAGLSLPRARLPTRTVTMVVFINVFHVDPADQQRLIDLLTQVTEEIVSKAPGFVSSTLHRGVDGAKVTMYARWRSLADYEAMRQDPAPRPFLEAALSIARFDPGLYDVVREFGPPEA